MFLELYKKISQSNTKLNKRNALRFIIGPLLLVGLVVGVVYANWAVVEHRFKTVTEGKVYRSGEMPIAKLGEKIRKYGIRAVVDLRRYSDAVETECSFLASQEVKHFHLPSEQVPTEKTVESFIEILYHKENYPILIHCKDGTGRSVLFSAIYRIEHEGWSNEAARKASRFLSFRGSFSPHAPKGIYLHNYVPKLKLGKNVPQGSIGTLSIAVPSSLF